LGAVMGLRTRRRDRADHSQRRREGLSQGGIPEQRQPMSFTPRPVKQGDHLVLVDGSSYIFRAYHALPPLTRKSDGLPVGAVSGFCNMLWKLMRDKVDGERPTHLAVIFDASAATFRNTLFDQYKADRPEAPDDLKPQFRLIREAVRAFDIPCLEQDGFEADDLIATYVCQASDNGATVTIVASDKDLMQLVRPGVVMYDSMKEKRIDELGVLEKFGVPPEKVVDVQALAGDSIDNVPGVPGIGIKTAAQLINEYGDLETLLERASEIKQPKRREALIAFAEQARMSKKLVKLECDVPLKHPIDELGIHEPHPTRLVSFLRAMEFYALMRRVAAAYEVQADEIEPDPRLLPGGEAINWGRPADADSIPFFGDDEAPAPASAPGNGAGENPIPAPARRPSENLGTPLALAARIGAQTQKPFEVDAYETITTMECLHERIAQATAQGHVAVDLQLNSIDPLQADLVGIALALEPCKASYIPLQHRGGSDLFGGGLVPGQLGVEEVLGALKPLFEDRSVLKIGHDIKTDRLVLQRHGIALTPFDDVMLMSYVLDAGKGPHGKDELSRRHLAHAPIAFEEVAGTGRTKVTFDQVEIARATGFASEGADITLRLWRLLKPRLIAERRLTVYETLERPLIDVLARMEERGIGIDRQVLSRLSGDFAQTLGRLEAEIHELAGENFAIGSPKQIGDILFGKMGLPGAKKTPSGQWATPATLLEELAEAGHELPRKILEWRQLSKLKSTYTDSLPEYVNPETKRIHTSFALAATTTGRLSSSEPNLQNIPIRTEEGRKIRTAFVAQPGNKIISADYSQIELRILAHIAEIPQLRQAFADGIDIHAATAAAMFGVPLKGLDPDLRRKAKTINFGIIYGISAFGLAVRLGIPNGEAAAFIKQYFERFPGIRDYMETTKRACREQGYVTTLFGRVCHYPQIRSSNPQERAAVERQAINAPIQGSAADIIRRAMTRIDAALAKKRLSARMLLQVHDELVFEAPDEEVEATLPVIAKVMEQAAFPAIQLRVPLAVDARAAQNWDEAH
jgi:DNA polymerase I